VGGVRHPQHTQTVPFRAYNFYDHRTQILQLSFPLLQEILSFGVIIFNGISVGHSLIVLNRCDVQPVTINHIRTEGNILFKNPFRTTP
jgi:hypothetical protein